MAKSDTKTSQEQPGRLSKLGERLQAARKNQILFGLTMGVVTVGFIAAVWYLLPKNEDSATISQQSSADVIDRTPHSKERPYDYDLEQVSYDVLKTRVEQYTFTEQYSDAVELIRHQEYFADSKEAQQLLVSTHINANNKEDALQSLLDMENTFGVDQSIAINIGDMAAGLDDKDLAEEYYRKAIDYTQNNRDQYPLADSDIEDIVRRISQL